MNFHTIVVFLQRVEAGLNLIGATIRASAGELYAGLLHTFSEGANRPDVVICDFPSIGCHEYAVSLGIPMLLNNADVLQTQITNVFDYDQPMWDAYGRLRTHTHTSDEENRFRSPWNVHLRAIQASMLAASKPLTLALFAYFEGELWPGRPAHLPPLGDTLVNSANLLLQNTFFPFEAPQSIPANIVLTGPALSRYMQRRGQDTLARIPVDPDVLLVDDMLREWLGRSDEPVLYVSLGTVFSVHDNVRVNALVAGFLRAGVRIIWKTHKVDDVVAGLRQSGVLPGAADRVLVVRWVASQLDLLVHPSISLFLSHCGTNSVLEALSLGRHVVCLPIGQTQVMTAVQLVRVGAMKAYIDVYAGKLEEQAESAIRHDASSL
jgi:hypothetical protein